MAHDDVEPMVVPKSIVSRVDVAHLERELEAIDNFMEENRIRQAGDAVTMPKLSGMFEDFARTNKLNLLQATEREKMRKFIVALKKDGPVIHIAFASEPSAQFVGKITDWIRKEINPYVMIQVGIQPNIAAGCVVRTTNKRFDFSLRQHLLAKQPDLVEILGGRA